MKETGVVDLDTPLEWDDEYPEDRWECDEDDVGVVNNGDSDRTEIEIEEDPLRFKCPWDLPRSLDVAVVGVVLPLEWPLRFRGMFSDGLGSRSGGRGRHCPISLVDRVCLDFDRPANPLGLSN